jgi:hypothetical protein
VQEVPDRLRAEDLPPTTRWLCEQLLLRIPIVSGRGTLELVVGDGKLRDVFRKERIAAGALKRFDEASS